MREVKLIKFKRIHIDLRGHREDKYGHWWFEIGDPCDRASESYGWWPAVPLNSVFQCARGVEGKLNGRWNRSRPRRDPHHGEPGEEEFHALARLDDHRTDDEIANCLRRFAIGYEGNWQWIAGWGQNCHSFQISAIEHCGLTVPEHVQRNTM